MRTLSNIWSLSVRNSEKNWKDKDTSRVAALLVVQGERQTKQGCLLVAKLKG